MPAHHRKLKTITFALGAFQYECQVQTWNVTNNSEDGEKHFTFCPDGEFREESDPDYALDLTFFSDWRSDGISDFLWANDGTDAAFTLDHHPDIVGEHVRWTGTVRIKAPTAGGEVRTEEQTQVTLQIQGTPVYTRV